MGKKFEINIRTIFNKSGLSRLNSGLKGTINLAKSAGGFLKKIAGRAVIGGLALVTAAVWKLVGALRAFAKQELSEVNLVASLKQMGVFTDAYYEKLVRLASQFQETTKVGDEVWLKQFAQLTRFGMNSKNVDKVSEALKNLAGLMDGNVQGAALAMQRALEGEFSMFSRYGIKLDLTGDKIRDLNNLFTMLAQKGGGAMEARANTLQGAWDGLSNALGDFKEEVGRAFSESSRLPEMLGKIEDRFKDLQQSAKTGGLKRFIEGAVDKAREFLELLQGIGKFIQSGGMEAAGQMFSAAKDVVISVFEMAAEAAIKVLAVAIPTIGRAFGKAALSALWGRDKADSRAKKRARWQSSLDAEKEAEGKFGAFDKSKGVWGSHQNRERERFKKEREEEIYNQLLPKFLQEELQSDGGKLAATVSGRGRERFDDARARFVGAGAEGQQLLEKEQAEKQAQSSALANKGFQYIRGGKIQPLDNNSLLQTQFSQEHAARERLVGAEASGSAGAVQAARDALARERQETAQMIRIMQDMAENGREQSSEMLILMQDLIRDNEQMRRDLRNLQSQSNRNRG